MRGRGRPINLGRNHWKQEVFSVAIDLVMQFKGRPINLGRNHWKLGSAIFHCPHIVVTVAPLTWGGIIGNAL